MKKIFYILISFTILLSALFLYFETQLNQPFVPQEKKIYFTAGTKTLDILSVLEQENIVPSKWPLFLSFLLHPHHLSLKSGEYKFEKGMTPFDVMETISKGKVIIYKFTIPEGFTSFEIIDRIQKISELEGHIQQIPAEGSLFPSTYEYKRGQTKEFLVEKIKKTMNDVLKELMEKHPEDSLKEKIIMASLVEKETAVDHERPRIAGLFYNRLAKKIKLQCDPTVIYSLTFGKFPLNRPLSKTDLKHNSPYNTYRYEGLPPGPICNPGRSSLEAVFNPLKTNDLYFVAKEGKEHTFSQSLNEHNKAVRILRKKEKIQ